MHLAEGVLPLSQAIAWILAIVALALLGGVALDSNADVIVQTSVRVLCGTIWILWLGTQVDWASLRQLLLWLRMPEGVVALRQARRDVDPARWRWPCA